jgi:hypothetical protein
MFHNEYMAEQLRTARQHDLLEAAERSRLAAEARTGRRSQRSPLAWRWRKRTPPVVESPACAPAAR